MKSSIEGFLKLTGKTMVRPEEALKSLENHPFFGIIGYTLSASFLLILLNVFGANFGLVPGSDPYELAFASVVILPFFALIPLGFVHLNATVMKMGGSFWPFYSRALWALYIWILMTFIASIVVTLFALFLPIKFVGFFAYLPNFYTIVLLYLSLKVTNALPHWKALAIWGTSGTLFYLAVLMVK